MVNQEILGGLRLSLKRGETLEKAMNTFYNAGYKKEEIEHAARALQREKLEPTPKAPQIPELPNMNSQIPKNNSKKVSDYDSQNSYAKNSLPIKNKSKTKKIVLITSIVFVLVLIGVSIAYLLMS